MFKVIGKVLKSPVSVPVNTLKSTFKSNYGLVKEDTSGIVNAGKDYNKNLRKLARKEERQKREEEKRRYKKITFDELLEEWGTNRQELKSTKRGLIAQLVMLVLLIIYATVNFALLEGTMVLLSNALFLFCIVAKTSFVLYRLYIFTTEEYYTYREFLFLCFRLKT